MTESDELNVLNEIRKSSGDQFFAAIEKYIKIKIPEYVKNVLKITGFDCAIVFSKFTAASFQDIEIFMQDVFNAAMLQNKEEMNQFLGIYEKCQKLFKFLPGHKAMLGIIAETCERICKAKTRTRANNPSGPSQTDETVDLSDELIDKLFENVKQWICGQKTVTAREVRKLSIRCNNMRNIEFNGKN